MKTAMATLAITARSTCIGPVISAAAAMADAFLDFETEDIFEIIAHDSSVSKDPNAWTFVSVLKSVNVPRLCRLFRFTTTEYNYVR